MTDSNDDDISGGFSEWYPLTAEGVDLHAPDAPAAVQLGTAQAANGARRLVPYPKGKSAMVFYFYAARSSREALRRLFAEELDTPGARGQGELVFRVLRGGDAARLHLERLYFEFDERFGSPPVLHALDSDDSGESDEDRP